METLEPQAGAKCDGALQRLAAAARHPVDCLPTLKFADELCITVRSDTHSTQQQVLEACDMESLAAEARAALADMTGGQEDAALSG